MIEVELPDGAVVEFPDDTPPDVMQAALRQQFGGGQAPAAPEPPGFLEGRLAGIRGGFNELVATGADQLATPGKVIASFAGIDPEKARIDFAGIPLTDIAEDQRGAAMMERGIQQQATPKGGAAQFGTELLDAAINMAPSVATSYITKSPNLPLAVMGGQVFSTELTRSMNEGKSKDEAVKDAAIATAFEIGPEKAFGFFDDLPVTKGAKAWLRQVVAESISESATETLNITDERYRQGEDIGTFADTLLRTGKAGAMGAAMGGGFAAPALLRGQEPQVAPEPPPVAPEAPPPPVAPEVNPLEQVVQQAVEQQARPEIPQPTVIDPVQEARERLRTMMPQVEPEATIPGPESPIVPQEPAPLRESQPVEQQPSPVQERSEAPVDEDLTPEQVADIEAKLTDVKRPPTLLDAIAGLRIRLDRKKFRGDLAQQENLQVGNKWLYEGERSEFEGMGPDELLEWMQQEGWLPENTPEAPNQVTVNDAVDLLNRALRGDRIVHDMDMDSELDYQQARQYEIDKAAGEGFGVTDEADAVSFADIAQAGEKVDPAATDEEIDQQFEALWNTTESTGSTDWLKEGENVDQGTSEGGIPAGSATGAETLIPEATGAENLRAEAERKTAERNRLGQDEVPVEQGEGELFAGNEAGVRPTQNTIFTEEAVEAARTRLKSKLGTARSGVDPEMLKDMAIVAGYHIEKGARTFQAFSKAMIDDLGDRIKPHLTKLWEENKPPDVPSEPKARPVGAPEEGKTSTKNAVTNAEREARNQSPAFFSFRESNAELVARAEQKLKDNPDAAQELITRLLDEADPSINRLDLAILMVHKTDVRQAMARQGERLQNENLTDEQRAVTLKRIADLDVTMDEIDQAAVVAGAVWGGWGQLRSKFILEDYTLESQIARTSQMIQSAVTPEMKTFLEEATKRISKLENELADHNRKMQDEIDRRVSAEVQAQMAKRIEKEMRSKPAKTAKKKLQEIRNSEIEWLKKHSAQLNALPAEHVYHLAKLGGVIMAEGAIEFTAWVARIKQYLGDKLFGQIEDSLDEIYALSQDEYHKVESEVERPSVEDVLNEAEALAEIDEPVPHRVVYKLVEAFLAQGLRGENQVMQAVHKALQEFYPDLTESSVRHTFTEYGKPKFPSEEELKVLARELKVMVRLGISIERLQEGLSPLRTGPQRGDDKFSEEARQKIRDKTRVLNWLMREMDRKNPNPTRRSLASINEQRVRRLENQIADLEKQIKTGEKPPKRDTPLPDSPEVADLKKRRDALKKHLADIEAAKKPELTPEEKYNKLRGKQLRRQLADIQRRIREKDYERHPRKQMPALSRENVQLQGEVAKAKFELHMKQMEWQREQMSGFQKTWDATKQFSSLARASMTSTDLSAVGRQGGFLLYASPNTARKAFLPMIRSIRSDADAHAIMQEIESRPNYRHMQAAKLFFSDQMSGDWRKMEEIYQSRWQEHFPHIKISARAYTAFLNKLRADYFDAVYNRMIRSGPLTKEELLDLGDLINNATGRADLGRFSSEGISSIFFAPRWVISRFNMILYPLKAAGMLPGKSGKRMSAKMRKEVARQLVNFVSSYVIIWGLLGFMFGDEADEDDPLVSFDPFSPDFAKLKIGNTRMDITAGLSNAIRFTAMSLDAAWDAASGTGEIDDARRYGRYLMRFLWSKLAPIPSSTVNSMVGHNVIGETPQERGEFLRETLKMPDWLAEHRVLLEVLGWSVPLSLRDFYDSAVDAGIPPAIAFQVFSTLGWGIVTYERDEQKKEGRPERPERPKRPSRPERPTRD